MHHGSVVDLQLKAKLEELYRNLIEFAEIVASNLYKLNLERLRKLDPNLDEVAVACDQLIELLEAG